MNYYTQVLSAKVGASQAPHLIKGDALGDKASNAVGKVWRKIAHLLRRKKQPPNFYHRLESLLWEVLSSAHDTLGDGLEEIASSASATTQQLLFAALPPGHRNLLASTKALHPSLEAKATPAEEKEIKSMLFKPQSLAKAKAIVKAPTAGVSWQARLAQQTKLGEPKQLASIITQWRNSGKTPKEMEKAMLPFVQGVRTTARRVARTEAQRVASMTRMETYEELGDLAVGYQIHATMDSHTRPHHAARSGQIYYKQPKPGQLGLDKMPQPPHEPDGSVAFNCRCYITPVMDIQPQIENDPAAKKVFADADKQLIPDPSVYRDWFAGATKLERAKAVGASRLRAIQNIVGVNGKVDWSHMLDPATGKLLTVQQIKNESEAQRNRRLGKVMDVLSKRKLLARQVAQFGYVSPPVEQAVMGVIPPLPTPPLLPALPPPQIPVAPPEIQAAPVQVPAPIVPPAPAPAASFVNTLIAFKNNISGNVTVASGMKKTNGKWKFDGFTPIYVGIPQGTIKPIHTEIEAAYKAYRASLPPAPIPYDVTNPQMFPGKVVMQTPAGLIAVDPSEVPASAQLLMTQNIATGDLVPKAKNGKVPAGHIAFYINTASFAPVAPVAPVVVPTTYAAPPVKFRGVQATAETPCFEIASWNQPFGVNKQKAAIGIPPAADGKRISYSPPLDLSRAKKVTARDSVLPPPKGPLLRIKSLGGTTGADLMEDATGKQFVRKLGTSKGHVETEIAADKLYAACGVPVPKVMSVDDKGATIKLAEFIEGKSYAEFMDSPDTPPEEKAKVKKQLQSQFAVDALLGNWDVTGMNRDNILIGKDGVAYRIDNGGAMGFRAQGTPKTSEQWNPYPTELWSMAQPERIGSGDARGQAAELFHDLPWGEVVEQIENLVASRAAILTAAPESDREMLGKRLDSFADIAATHHVLTKDFFTVEYTKEILRHQQGIRAAGLTDKLPLRLGDLTGETDNPRPKAKINGPEFGNLRGYNSLSQNLEKYIRNDPELAYSWIEGYSAGQAASTESTVSIGAANIMLEARPVDETTIYPDKYGIGKERKKNIDAGVNIANCTPQQAKRTTAAMHAWQMEIMRNVDMPNNNRAEGKARLIRTESDDAIDGERQAAKWDKPIDITGKFKPLMLASYSMFRPYQLHNATLIAVEVPHHRIIASYLIGTGGSGMFAGDFENEFVVMADSVPAVSYGKSKPLTGKYSWTS